MAHLVYVLCALTSVACAVLLLKGHQRSRMPLLFWSGLCFVGLALNNLFLLADLVFAPQIDFAIPRNLAGVIGTSLLLYGMLWTKSQKGGAWW